MIIVEYIITNWILFVIAIGYLWVLLFIIYAESKLDLESEEVQNKYLKAINKKSFIKTKPFITGRLIVFIMFMFIDLIFNKEILIYWLVVLLLSGISNKILWRICKNKSNVKYSP